MQIEYFYYLIEIANIGSFSLAAEKLFLSQQRLSDIVAKIENAFNLKIFVRSKKGLSLTPQGKRFIADVQNLLNQYDYLQKEYIQEKKDTANLRVLINPIISDLFFEKVIDSFHQSHSSSALSIIEEENILTILQNVRELKADLAITSLPPSIFHSKKNFIDLTFEDLFIDQLCCLVPNTHPFAQKNSVLLEDCLKEPLILDNKDLLQDYFLDYYIRKYHLNPNYKIAMSVSGFTTLKMVKQNIGIGFIFKFQIRKMPTSELKAIPIKDIEPFHFILAYSNKISPSKSFSSFKKTYIDTIKKCALI